MSQCAGAELLAFASQFLCAGRGSRSGTAIEASARADGPSPCCANYSTVIPVTSRMACTGRTAHRSVFPASARARSSRSVRRISTHTLSPTISTLHRSHKITRGHLLSNRGLVVSVLKPVTSSADRPYRRFERSPFYLPPILVPLISAMVSSAESSRHVMLGAPAYGNSSLLSSESLICSFWRSCARAGNPLLTC